MLPFDLPLITPHDQWPIFDEVISNCTPSPPLTTTLPSAAALAALPIPPSRTSPRNKNPNHIPRPRNAFMLFRSAFAAAQKIGTNIENDNRHITRVIAHCWNRLSDPEKQVWRDKAAAEKVQHAERYPNYRFSPVGRRNKPVKRNVRRNGVEDVKRCEKLAELVMAGKFGQELETAVKKFDNESHSTEHTVDVFTSPERHKTPRNSEPSDVPPFRSPLLPPTKTASQQAPDENFMPQHIATPNPVESQSFYPLTDTSASDDLSYLLQSPCHQYYQPSIRDESSSPRTISPLEHFQSIMRFVHSNCTELEQSAQDSTPFSWNQSDSFLYYH